MRTCPQFYLCIYSKHRERERERKEKEERHAMQYEEREGGVDDEGVRREPRKASVHMIDSDNVTDKHMEERSEVKSSSCIDLATC